MRPTRRLALMMGLVLAPLPARAHPHIFVDTGIEVIFDDQRRATGVRIHWTYDDLITLTILSERGLDADFDGELNDQERAALPGFDMDWEVGYPGDTYALLGTVPLALSGPTDFTADYAGGRLESSHLRLFDQPVVMTDAPLLIQSYDPSFYTSYTVTEATLSGGDGCQVQIFEPDRDAADKILQDAISELAGGDGAEGDFPAVGAAYAEEARVTCGVE